METGSRSENTGSIAPVSVHQQKTGCNGQLTIMMLLSRLHLFHYLGSFLVVELQLGDGLVDAHASDLFRGSEVKGQSATHHQPCVEPLST